MCTASIMWVEIAHPVILFPKLKVFSIPANGAGAAGMPRGADPG
jgi:hypothetical protein